MGELHILDAGRADCSLVLTGARENPHVAVIDGGKIEYQNKGVLLDFLQRRGIERIHLMILTHMHQDHFGGFYNLIGRVNIDRAVMPFGDLALPPAAAACFGPDECFWEYHRFYTYLQETGVEMIRDFDCVGRVFPLGEGAALRCLYPLEALPSANAGWLEQLNDPALSEGDLEEAVAGYQATCNASSSIWALEKGGRTAALLAGDSTLETMAKALPLPMGPPDVLKLSHHGINKCYFSPAQVAQIAPRQSVVVCNGRAYYNEIKQNCEEACAAAGRKPLYTFQGDFIYHF